MQLGLPNKNKFRELIQSSNVIRNTNVEVEYPGFEEDLDFLYDHLINSIASEDSSIFLKYIEWVNSYMISHSIPLHYLKNIILVTQEIEEVSKSENDFLAKILERSLELIGEDKQAIITTYLDKSNPLFESADEFLNLLLKGNRSKANDVISELVKVGTPISTIYEHVFQTSLYEIGRLWQLNKISVAEEHFFTAATQLIMSQLYPQIFGGKKNGLKMVGCSLEGNLHEVGIRMVTDIFELNGWDSYYVGSNVPRNDLVDLLNLRKPNLIAISVSLSSQINTAKSIIQQLRQVDELANLKILVGGQPLYAHKNIWKDLGADAMASNPKDAIEIGRELVENV